jgi:hypothetical protein
VNNSDPSGLITCPSWVPGCGTVTNVQNGISSGATNTFGTAKVLGGGAAYVATGAFGSGLDWVDAHVNVSIIACIGTCFGYEVQGGNLYQISSTGYLLGGSASVNVSASSAAPSCGNQTYIGAGPVDATNGPGTGFRAGGGYGLGDTIGGGTLRARQLNPEGSG